MTHAHSLRLTGIGCGDPFATVARVDDAFGDAHAWIQDVHFFSGVQTVLHFEVARERLDYFALRIAQAGVVLDEPSLAALDAAATEGDGFVEGSLAITLAHGDPDMRHDVPA
jgi:hypothetical protein